MGGNRECTAVEGLEGFSKNKPRNEDGNGDSETQFVRKVYETQKINKQKPAHTVT